MACSRSSLVREIPEAMKFAPDPDRQSGRFQRPGVAARSGLRGASDSASAEHHEMAPVPGRRGCATAPRAPRSSRDQATTSRSRRTEPKFFTLMGCIRHVQHRPLYRVRLLTPDYRKYLAEIRKFPMLKPEEEKSPTLSAGASIGIATPHFNWSTSHLRLVAKIAMRLSRLRPSDRGNRLRRQRRPDAGG